MTLPGRFVVKVLIISAVRASLVVAIFALKIGTCAIVVRSALITWKKVKVS